MTCTAPGRHLPFRLDAATSDARGFSLIEFLLASMILLLIAGSAFEILSRAQRAAAGQSDMQEVMDNAHNAMDTLMRYLRQAGNDPLGAGFDGITIVGISEARIRSDLTGSAGRSNPDKGDPDGDVDDSYEDLTISYSASDRTIEVTPAGGSAQAIAGNIGDFTMQYLDADGAETNVGSEIRRIRVTLTTIGNLPDPWTYQYLRVRLTSDVRVATRR